MPTNSLRKIVLFLLLAVAVKPLRNGNNENQRNHSQQPTPRQIVLTNGTLLSNGDRNYQLYQKYTNIQNELSSGTHGTNLNSKNNLNQDRFVDGKLPGHVGIRGGPIDKKYVNEFVKALDKPKPGKFTYRQHSVNAERFNDQGMLNNYNHVGIRGGVDLKKYMYPISQQKGALERPPAVKYQYLGNGNRFTNDGKLNIGNIPSIREAPKQRVVFTLDNYKKGIYDPNARFLI